LPRRTPQIARVDSGATTAAGTAGASRATWTSAGARAATSSARNAAAQTETWPGPATTSTAACATAFRSKNHLQHLVGIFKKVAVLFALGAKHLGCQLRGNLDSGHGRIFRDVANLVYLDAGLPGESRFQLLREGGRLGISAGEGADKACQLRLRQRRSEVDAGDTRRNQ
jgi:hypothetical protein